jgi:copper(I)-binding protein
MKLLSKTGLFILLLMLVSALFLAGCGGNQGPDIRISDPWARPSPKMATSGAAYMIIENKGNEDDALIGVEGDVSDAIEIHEMLIDENNVMRMKPVEGQRLVIPAKSKVELKPGGYHIMLIGLKKPLQEGEEIEITLKFEKSGDIKVKAPVKMMDMGG